MGTRALSCECGAAGSRSLALENVRPRKGPGGGSRGTKRETRQYTWSPRFITSVQSLIENSNGIFCRDRKNDRVEPQNTPKRQHSPDEQARSHSSKSRDALA